MEVSQSGLVAADVLAVRLLLEERGRVIMGRVVKTTAVC